MMTNCHSRNSKMTLTILIMIKRQIQFAKKHTSEKKSRVPQIKLTLMTTKGSFQKRFSGFCPLRGGGYPPFPLSFFEHNDCPLRGGGTPQFR